MISAIMATYNRGDVIENAIRSVMRQTYNDWELIVVMDGCTDNTADVVNRLAEEDSRIQVYKQPKMEYYTHVRNFGLQKAKGDLVCFRDDDSAWLPTFFEEMMKPHRNEDVLVTYCGRMQFTGVPFGQIDITKLADLAMGEPLNIPVFQDTNSLTNRVDVGDLMIKTSAVNGVGGFSREKDQPGYCSDAKLLDNIAAHYPDGRFVRISKWLHYYFLDNGAKRPQMTLEKLQYRNEHGKPHPDLEGEWRF